MEGKRNSASLEETIAMLHAEILATESGGIDQLTEQVKVISEERDKLHARISELEKEHAELVVSDI